jgi:hypothetical protein
MAYSVCTLFWTISCWVAWNSCSSFYFTDYSYFLLIGEAGLTPDVAAFGQGQTVFLLAVEVGDVGVFGFWEEGGGIAGGLLGVETAAF